jgi:hypothetical protein
MSADTTFGFPSAFMLSILASYAPFFSLTRLCLNISNFSSSSLAVSEQVEPMEDPVLCRGTLLTHYGMHYQHAPSKLINSNSGSRTTSGRSALHPTMDLVSIEVPKAADMTAGSAMALL